MTKGELAKKYFIEGKNCSQAVVLAFEKEVGATQEQIEKMVIGLGGGLARLRLTCGAVSGMAVVLGSVFFSRGKGEVYAIIQKACALFNEEAGSINCGELLSGITKDNTPIPSERTDEYYKKRPCADLCLLAGDITQKIIEEYR